MRYLIIFLSFLSFYSNAQPLPSIIIVDSISFSKKPLFVKKIKANNTKTTIYFLSLSMKKTMPIAISNNGKNIFIYKKDTMSIILSLEERKQIFIENLHFQKGKFLINFENCNFQSNYHIKNFPCDCLNYRREEE
ncbi:hypothetical protein [Capnocytophaga gingivalis]|uniref:Uncharacterized protein n=1 Tax=Capnocytophaga gingivalis TaxID=1017 RepID=A0ABU5YAQ8_9FLAO|nr:hypothetical protein [Capnocytophaga gingivalis]MEB3041031.1 hypothetical protein [Capnocytophaga gingivalis]